MGSQKKEAIAPTCTTVAQRILPIVLHRKKHLTLKHLNGLIPTNPNECLLPQLITLTTILLSLFGFFHFNDLPILGLDWPCSYDNRVEIFFQAKNT